MANLQITYDDSITLRSRWSCTVTYLYNSYGAFNSIGSTSQDGPDAATTTIQFAIDLPVGAAMTGVKVHATYDADGTLKINNVEPDDEGYVALDVADISSGVADVEFSWLAKPDSARSHSDYPTYNGNSSQSKTYWHYTDVEVTDVFLLVEYKMNGLIYRAVSGSLVPYQIYRAEDGALVPYLLFKAVDNELVQY
jgi:hypothetical protein